MKQKTNASTLSSLSDVIKKYRTPLLCLVFALLLAFPTIPARAPWPEENKARLEQIFAPFGGVVYVAAEHVLDMLAALCVIEIVPLMLFDLSDATGLDSSVLASAMRAAHQVRFEYLPIGSTPCSMADAPQESAQLLAQIDVRWMDAMVGFLTGLGMEQETAEKILIANLDLKLHCCQLQPRAKSEDRLQFGQGL